MRSVLLFLVVALGASAGVSEAAPISFRFTGTVTFANGIWASQGSDVVGNFTFDSELVDRSAGDPEFDLFRAGQPVANLNKLWEFSVTVGRVTRTTADNANRRGSDHHSVSFTDRDTRDSFSIGAGRKVPGDDEGFLELRDFSPSPPDAISPGSGNLTDTPLTRLLDPALFDDRAVGFYTSYDPDDQWEGSLQFDVTAILPEPSGVLLLLVAFGAGYRRNRNRRTPDPV